MNSNDVFSQLCTRQGPGFGAGLCAFSQLLACLNNPQNSFQILHVAGTNGKGSVCTLLAHALTCAGKKTGLFVSPHLLSPTERISINGEEISQDDFACCVQRVLAAEQEPLNFFEILTAAALVYFADKKAEYVVLETGLGGRKDPTNVCIPCASVITSIGLDHTAVLGGTIEEIAAEKAGIIKPKIPVFCGPVAPEVRQVIRQTAAAQKSPVYFIKEGDPFSLKNIDIQRGNLRLEKEKNIFSLHLLGKFQPVNACVVWHVLRFLNVPQTAIFKAFETVQVPGRFEVIKKGKNTFVVDGAHNPQAVAALMDFWQTTPYANNAVLVCGFMKDKDYKKMIELLTPHFKKIIVTVPPGSFAKNCSISRIETLRDDGNNFSRAAGKAELARFLARPGITFEPEVSAAVDRASKSARVVLCTGSFYLAGAVKKHLNGRA